jgi:hypothetical protein
MMPGRRCKSNGDNDVDSGSTDGGDDDDVEHQHRKRENDVGNPGQDIIHPATAISGRKPH